ncbi:MAG: oligoendopeptidase F [Tissierellia bacterium]|nr:oligoendopeptidase F [Tissierellia bacterium]
MRTNNRSEIESKYKWDIISMYPEDSAWENEYNQVIKGVENLAKYKGHLLDSGSNLYEGIQYYLDLERKIGNLATFAHMNLDQDTREGASQALMDKANSLMVLFMQASSFIDPELMELDDEAYGKFVEEDSRLNDYAQLINDRLRRRAHILTPEKEEVIASFGEVTGASAKTYGMFNNADMKFPSVIDSKGEEHLLTSGTYIPLVESVDRTLRENAFKTLYHTYDSYKNTLTSTLFGALKGNQVISELRGFNSSREAALFENNIPETVYDALIEGVHDKIGAFHKYIKLRKNTLKVEELHMYDVYTPIVEVAEDSNNIPYEKAVSMVLEAIKPLGEEYYKIAKEGLENGWVDVYENEGKRSGAYSSGSYDSKPYILLNYKGTLDNVFTLIHELGHSMHSYLTRKNQPYQYGDYSIFLAEIASTCNEQLLLHYLLEKEKDNLKERKILLNHSLDSFRGTVYRQTMFAEFEHEINKQMQAGLPFTAQWLKDKYLEINKYYYGADIVSDDEIAIEWARIPHFYYNYYVFQYATGFSAAVAFSEAIINEGQPAVDRYLKFLKAGCSDYPVEVLKNAGIDMENPRIVGYALEKFEKLVREMESLV